MLRVPLLLLLVCPAAAYIRIATAVGGDVVKGAGDLTKGGKVGLYTVLLQVLNPNFGTLKQMLECCGKSRDYAGKMATLSNTNSIQGDDIEGQVRDMAVGDGKCSDPGLGALMKEGDPTCSYLYSFENKDQRSFSSSAMCVPSDACSVDVAGATKGLKVGYSVVLQILNRNYGDLEYAGEGPLSSCYDGMNMVNLANTSFRKVKESFAEIGGIKIPTGKKAEFSFENMQRLGLLKMLGKCEPRADTGILYVFKNKFWSNGQHALNITHFDWKLAKKQAQEVKAKDQSVHVQLQMGQDEPVVTVEKSKKMTEETPEEEMQEKISDISTIAKVTKEKTAGVAEDDKMKVAKAAIAAAEKKIAQKKDEKASAKLEGGLSVAADIAAATPAGAAAAMQHPLAAEPLAATAPLAPVPVATVAPVAVATVAPVAVATVAPVAPVALPAMAPPPLLSPAPATPALPATPAAPVEAVEPKAAEPEAEAPKPEAKDAAAGEAAEPEADPDAAPPTPAAPEPTEDLAAAPPRPQAPQPDVDGTDATLRMAEDEEVDNLERSAEIFAEQQLAKRRLDVLIL